MKTDELISLLATDTVPGATVRGRMMRALPLAAIVSVMAVIGLWGIRPDFGTVMGSAVVLKNIVPLVVAVLAGALAFALTHPAMPTAMRSVALSGVGVALVVVLIVTLAQQGLSALPAALVTPSLLVCLVSIPILAVPFLAAGLWALSAGAALRPRLAGAAAGLFAGGAATSIYALYCTQDALLFVLPAYAAAILVVALAGALAGPRALAW